MAEARDPWPTRLVVGMLAADEVWLARGREVLTREWGEALCSDVWSFAHTAYYAEEMGPTPCRQFLAFPGAFDPGDLPERKLRANALERELAERDGVWPRPVNLDPGYLAAEKLVLASCKNFSHRLYLRDGVYGELTLQYRAKEWRSLEWTFPEYASGRYDEFWTEVRDGLMRERDA